MAAMWLPNKEYTIAVFKIFLKTGQAVRLCDLCFLEPNQGRAVSREQSTTSCW